MHPVLLFMAAGYPFWIGMGLMLACVLAAWRKWLRAARVAGLVGLGCLVVSGTPMVMPFFGALFLAAAIAVSGGEGKHRRWALAAVLAVAALMSALEARYWVDPAPAAIDGTLYIVGDSIGSGDQFDGEAPYPGLLGTNVVNRSVAGATAESAFTALDGLEPGERDAILLEIGGNDLLGGNDIREFRRALNILLAKCRATGAKLLMLELPMPLLRSHYGEAQRELARKHGVAMIPKRHFVRVLGGPGATTDGIHLSNAGHREMAGMLKPFFTGLATGTGS